MRYILDASVALKFVLAETDSAKAIALRVEFKQHIHELLAPDVLPIEVAHTLTRAERKGLLTPPQATILFADVLSPPLDLRPSLPLLPRAIELSSNHRIGVYDCLYIALAEQEQCKLITADERLIQKFPGFAIVSLANL